MKQWLRILFLIFSLLIVTGCGSKPSQGNQASAGQPPVSVAQRHVSVLTPPGADSVNQPTGGGGEQAGVSLTPDVSFPFETPFSSQPGTGTDSPTPSPSVPNTETPTIQEPASPSPTQTQIPQTNPTASAVTIGTATSPPQSICDPAGGSAFEAEVVRLINQERAAEGLAAVSSQTQLTSAARGHSADMACNDFFSHTSPTTGTPLDRVTAAGYSYSWVGENIAAGHASPEEVVESWMSSPAHRANLLNENYSHIGIGFASWDDSDYVTYWTAVFASP